MPSGGRPRQMLPPILRRLHCAQGICSTRFSSSFSSDFETDALLHRRVLPVHDAAQRRVAAI